MSSQSSDKHSPLVDDEMAHEAQPIVQGHGSGHVEEFRQTVPLADDTDDPEVVEAERVYGELKPAPGIGDDPDGEGR